MLRKLLALVFVLLSACSADRSRSLAPAPGATSTSTSSSTSTSPTATTSTAPRGPVVIHYRIERHTGDDATADFAAMVDATLHDARGWTRAGFVFQQAADAPYTILLGEGPEVQQRCRPYDTYGRYSCQIGPLVAITADRWRFATPEWAGDLTTYRQMVVDHEIGHLLGLHHRDCTTPGRVAPVMLPQSTELHGCLPNPWPLPEEVARAARHDLPLAPGYESGDPRDTP